MLTPELIRYGYELGAFPMGDEWEEVSWFQPYQRALFPISGIHVSKSLAKTLREGRFEVRFDTSFEAVMRCCLRPNGNWITEEIITAYSQIHRDGWGHCSECWEGDQLVGGVYGIALGACFCAESMFFRRTDASKVALWALVEKCRHLGFQIFDAQIMNPHLASLGAFEVSHEEYMRRLKIALQKHTPWSRATI